MKHSILTIVTLLFCTTLFAQETNSCLFIGTYEKTKRGICGDYELVHEEVADYAEFVVKRIAFEKEHKSQSPNTKFINFNECVIAFQYEKKISGWNCNSTVISTRTSKSLDECNRLMGEQVTKYPKDFTTQPKAIFSWQGKSDGTNVYSEDFGGLNGKFTSGNTTTKSIIVAKLTNNTKNKLASVTLTMDNGDKKVYKIYPGESITEKCDTKNLDIKVIYVDNKVEPTIEVINAMKNFVRKRIINENGKLKTIPSTASSGVRG
jgi:hypothetical protein